MQQEGQEDSAQDKLATELLDREQKIVKLQHVIDELRENEKLMLAQYLLRVCCFFLFEINYNPINA